QCRILLILGYLRPFPFDLTKTEFEQVGHRVIWSSHEKKPLDHLKRGDWYLCLRWRVLRISFSVSKPLESQKTGLVDLAISTSWTVDRVNLKKRLFPLYSWIPNSSKRFE